MSVITQPTYVRTLRPFRSPSLDCDRPDWKQSGRQLPDQKKQDPYRPDHSQGDTGLERLRGQQLIRVAAFLGKSLLAAALLWLALAAPGFLAG